MNFVSSIFNFQTIMHCTFYPDNSHTPSPPVVRRAASVLALNITSSAPLSPLPPSTPTHPSSPISLSPAGSRPNSLHNGRGSPLQNQPLSQVRVCAGVRYFFSHFRLIKTMSWFNYRHALINRLYTGAYNVTIT